MIATIFITEYPERIKGDFEISISTIEAARTIITRAGGGFFSPATLVVRGLDSASEEIQNTFLKILEEHPDSVSFIFPVLSDSTILPTIRSRCIAKYDTRLVTEHTELYNWNQLMPPITSKKILPSVALKITNGKKEVYIAALQDYIHYCRTMLLAGKKQNTLQRAFEALRLIENNNADPELAFNTAFL